MRKSTLIWLVVASALLVTGVILYLVTLSVAGWDFSLLDTRGYETNSHEISTDFHSILVKTDTANIRFLPSPDGQCKVLCYETENARHTVRVENDTLTIKLVNNQKWYDHIGIHFVSPRITIYLPESVYGNLSVQADTSDVEIAENFTFEDITIAVSTGDIHMEGIVANNIKLTVSTGDVVARNIQCLQFSSAGSTGDLKLQQLMAKETIRIERSTGDVDFEGCDAAEITVTTDTGHIRGSLLSNKVFIAETDTGRVDVPHTTTGGKCHLTTDTGNIKISIR
jgi:hypothetical protein